MKRLFNLVGFVALSSLIARGQTNTNSSQYNLSNNTNLNVANYSGGLNSASQPMMLDWPAILGQQTKIYEATLRTEQSVSDKTLASVKQSYEHLVSVAQYVSVVVGIVVAVLGVAFAFVLKEISKIPILANSKIGDVDKKLTEFDGRFPAFEKRFNDSLQKASELLRELEVKMGETLEMANLAKLRGDLMSENTEDQLRAMMALAQNMSPLAIPLLKETLRSQQRPAQILAEAVYSLGRRRPQVESDDEIKVLIVNSIKHSEKQVRLESAIAMGRLAPHNSTFRTRLVEMRDNDVDSDVQRAAKHSLQLS